MRDSETWQNLKFLVSESTRLLFLWFLHLGMHLSKSHEKQDEYSFLTMLLLIYLDKDQKFRLRKTRTEKIVCSINQLPRDLYKRCQNLQVNWLFASKPGALAFPILCSANWGSRWCRICEVLPDLLWTVSSRTILRN